MFLDNARLVSKPARSGAAFQLCGKRVVRETVIQSSVCHRRLGDDLQLENLSFWGKMAIPRSRIRHACRRHVGNGTSTPQEAAISVPWYGYSPRVVAVFWPHARVCSHYCRGNRASWSRGATTTWLTYELEANTCVCVLTFFLTARASRSNVLSQDNDRESPTPRTVTSLYISLCLILTMRTQKR